MALQPKADLAGFDYSLRRVFSSLRATWERLYRAQSPRPESLDATRIKGVLLALENIRLMMPIGLRNASRARREELLQFLTGLRELVANQDFQQYGRSLTMRLAVPPPPQDDRFTFEARLFDGKSVVEATHNLIDIVEITLGLGRAENVQLELRELRRVVPAQKIAPVQFFFRDGRVAVLQTKSRADEDDRENVAAAKQQLQASGEKILEELTRSNCDKRLIETVKYMQEQLSRDGNIVQIGLSNIACETMCHAFQAELPDAVSAMLTAHTRGVDLYIGQFPEWHRFIENASSTQLAQSDVDVLKEAASALIVDLEAKPDLAEPEVPQTIRRINELLKRPGKSAKRAAFAMFRTLENLISNVFSHSIEFLEMTVKKFKEKASTAIAQSAAVILLTIVLNSATSIGGIAEKVSGAQWVKTAISIVQKQLQHLGD